MSKILKELLAEIKEDGYYIDGIYLAKDKEILCRIHYDCTSTSYCCGLHEYGNFRFYTQKLVAVEVPRDKKSSLYKGMLALAINMLNNIYDKESEKADEEWERENDDDDRDSKGETVAYGVFFTTNGFSASIPIKQAADLLTSHWENVRTYLNPNSGNVLHTYIAIY